MDKLSNQKLVLSDQYVDTARTVAEYQVVLSGHRLAHLMISLNLPVTLDKTDIIAETALLAKNETQLTHESGEILSSLKVDLENYKTLNPDNSILAYLIIGFLVCCTLAIKLYAIHYFRRCGGA